MNNELLQKIQEKLGYALDLINLDNTEKIYNYLINYVKTQALVVWVITFIIVILIIGFIIFAYEKSDYYENDVWNLLLIISYVFLVGTLMFFVFSTYELIMTTLYPAIKVIKLLN